MPEGDLVEKPAPSKQDKCPDPGRRGFFKKLAHRVVKVYSTPDDLASEGLDSTDVLPEDSVDPHRISRRAFVKKAGGVAAGLAATAVAGKFGLERWQETKKQEAIETARFQILLEGLFASKIPQELVPLFTDIKSFEIEHQKKKLTEIKPEVLQDYLQKICTFYTRALPSRFSPQELVSFIHLSYSEDERRRQLEEDGGGKPLSEEEYNKSKNSPVLYSKIPMGYRYDKEQLFLRVNHPSLEGESLLLPGGKRVSSPLSLLRTELFSRFLHLEAPPRPLSEEVKKIFTPKTDEQQRLLEAAKVKGIRIFFPKNEDYTLGVFDLEEIDFSIRQVILLNNLYGDNFGYLYNLGNTLEEDFGRFEILAGIIMAGKIPLADLKQHYLASNLEELSLLFGRARAQIKGKKPEDFSRKDLVESGLDLLYYLDELTKKDIDRWQNGPIPNWTIPDKTSPKSAMLTGEVDEVSVAV